MLTIFEKKSCLPIRYVQKYIIIYGDGRKKKYLFSTLN